MDFAVAGTVNRDRVTSPAGQRHTSLGGILYNVLTLSRCLEPGDTVRPIARLGAEDREEALRLLEGCPGVDPSGLRFLPGPSNLAELRYVTGEDRVETLTDHVGPLTDEELDRAAGCDLLLANLISGYELSAGQLGRLARSSTRIFLDIQSLTLTPPGEAGDRRPRAVPDRQEWCAAVEVLKGNETEIECLLGRKLDGPAAFAAAAREALASGPRVLVVTRGGRGVYVAGEGAGAEGRFLPAVSGVEIVDPTGCGDAFASGFVAGYVRGGDVVRAACLGQAVAAAVAGSRGLDPLRTLSDPRPAAERLWRETG